MTAGRRAAMRLAAATVGAAIVLLAGGAGQASAHVVIERAEPNPDGTTTIVFGSNHGCDLNPTGEFEVALPDGIDVVSSEPPAGWSSQVDSARVLLTGPPIPSLEETEFSITATVSGIPGDAIPFPTTQRCEGGGSYEWVDGDGGDYPAPTLIVTAALVPASAASADDAGASRGQVLAAIAVLATVAAGTGALINRRPAG